jgi:membrane-associated phospholipid phosphatase
MLKHWSKFFREHKQCWVLLYFLIYFPWFLYLEKTVTTDYHIIHCSLDDKIPFCEYFIIPYLSWFLFLAVTILWFLVKESKTDFYRLTGILFGGMTICLAICTIFPNGLSLRQEMDASKNVFSWLTSMIYSVDTSTNVFPSIHVYTTLVTQYAIMRSQLAKKVRWIPRATGILSILIILSTLFLKQHSVVDVTGGILLGLLMIEVVYRKAVVAEKKSYSVE